MRNIERERSAGIIKQLHSKTNEMRTVESRFWLPLEFILQEGFSQGKSARKIGKEIGKDHSTVTNWSRDLEIKIPRSPYVSKEDRQKLKTLAGNGTSYRGIGREIGKDHKDVKSLIERLGIKKEEKLPSKTEKRFKNGVRDGATLRAIGRRAGMTHKRVKRWIKKYGMEEVYETAKNARKI